MQVQPNAGPDDGPLVVIAETLRNDRFYAFDIVSTVSGIDLLQLGHPHYSQEDRPGFAACGYDDAGWPPLNSAGFAGLAPGKVYWIRFDVLVPALDAATDTTGSMGIDLQVFLQGALEVYLNGQLMERIGSLPEPGWDLPYRTAAFVPRRTVRLHFRRDGKPETIAIRAVHLPAGSSELSRGSSLALSGTGDTQYLMDQEAGTILQFGMFISVNLLILLLALSILSRDVRDKGWPQLAVFSFLMALTALCNSVGKVPTGLSLSSMDMAVNVNAIADALSLLFLVLLMRALFGGGYRRSTWFFIGLTAAVISADFMTGYFSSLIGKYKYWLLLPYFFEVLRQAWNAVRGKRPGAWVIAMGALIYVCLGHLFSLAYYDFGIGQEITLSVRTVIRFSSYLSMPVSIMIYMAVRSVHANRLLSRQRDELDVEVNERTAELRVEKERSDDLLHNILPEEVANELKATGHAVAKHFESATILFTDFKGFTEASEKLSPQDLVEELNTCFEAFDHIITAHGIEKIKTIGDAYMCVGGLPDPKSSTPADVVHAALEMQAFMIARKTERDAQGLPAFEMRLGIHTGPVIAGIVGVKKFQYDIWGDTVNIASRMESSGEVGRVNISEATYVLVKEVREVREGREVPAFAFTLRGKVQAKGKGGMEMYFVGKA